jgi:hypothetical protein
MSEKTVASEPTVSWSDYRYLSDQFYAQKKMIRLLVRILVDKKIIGEELAKTFEEGKKINPKILEWFEAKLWIQGAIKHKGALRAQLGIKEDETIPHSLLQQIVKTETGKTVSFRGKSITVTTQLKRRALLALKLGKMQ